MQESLLPHLSLLKLSHFSTCTRASPCEAELQELMEQIDIMVSNKKLDWERKMRALETRLDLRDQELANAQTCLDQKGQEVLSTHVTQVFTRQTRLSLTILSAHLVLNVCYQIDAETKSGIF